MLVVRQKSAVVCERPLRKHKSLKTKKTTECLVYLSIFFKTPIIHGLFHLEIIQISIIPLSKLFHGMLFVIEVLHGDKLTTYLYSNREAAHQAVTDYMANVGLGDYARSIINSLDKECNVTLPARTQEVKTCTFSMKTVELDQPIE